MEGDEEIEGKVKEKGEQQGSRDNSQVSPVKEKLERIKKAKLEKKSA